MIDGIPKYIGICEKNTTTLKDRMGRYKNLQGGSANREGTNQTIARLIKQGLTEGQVVHILAMRPTAVYRFVDLEVDLVKGLENPLIGRFDPEWNK